MATGDQLLEAVTADTIAHETMRASKHSLPIGTPCPNCHTALAGPWCYACGQRGEKYNRSIWRLIGEAMEGLTDLDGRIWQTVPRLIFRPGRLTRDYLDGHRAVQIPPFRIFLLVLVFVFFAGGVNFSATHPNFNLTTSNGQPLAKLSTSDKADVDQALSQLKANEPNIKIGSDKENAFWTARVRKAVADPKAFFSATAEWGNRLAVLMLPIAALMLSVLFAFKKNTYVFDHLIFSMHSLSFQGLLLSAIFLGGIWWGSAWWFLWLSPVHLFFHMRGTYRIGIFGALFRMFLLFIGSSVTYGLLVAGLFVIGLVTVQ